MVSALCQWGQTIGLETKPSTAWSALENTGWKLRYKWSEMLFMMHVALPLVFKFEDQSNNCCPATAIFQNITWIIICQGMTPSEPTKKMFIGPKGIYVMNTVACERAQEMIIEWIKACRGCPVKTFGPSRVIHISVIAYSFDLAGAMQLWMPIDEVTFAKWHHLATETTSNLFSERNKSQKLGGRPEMSANSHW